MGVLALLAFALTAGVGVYLLVTSTRPGAGAAAEDEPAPAPAARSPQPDDRHRFDPPSLTAAKAAPIPGGRALAEFAHPLLGISAAACFFGYILTRNHAVAVIALGVCVAAVAAGVTWATVNARAARRAATSAAPDPHAMAFTPRLLLLHGAGAAVAIVLSALIAARL